MNMAWQSQTCKDILCCGIASKRTACYGSSRRNFGWLLIETLSHEGCVHCRFRPEAEHSANAGLHIARELLEPIKKKYPWISYSDLWTLAGCVAIEELGGKQGSIKLSMTCCECQECTLAGQ